MTGDRTGLQAVKLAEFQEVRPVLFSIAYRLSGSVAEAEDAVQETWLRYDRTATRPVSVKAFLSAAVTRVALNVLASSRVRREAYVGQWLPEPLLEDPYQDPERSAELADSVSMAALLLLERECGCGACAFDDHIESGAARRPRVARMHAAFGRRGCGPPHIEGSKYLSRRSRNRTTGLFRSSRTRFSMLGLRTAVCRGEGAWCAVLGPDDLVLCAGTVLGSGFRERAEAAAAAGFSGITLWAQDWKRALDEGLTPADMRAILDDHGLSVGELDAVTDWLPAPGGVTDAAGFSVPADVFWEIAEALGGRSLNVVEIAGAAVDPEQAAEAFAALCDKAAGYGLLVHLEFLPWSGIPDIHAAARITTRADRPNGGILLDTWHHYRSGGGLADLTEDVMRRVNGIQISDAPAPPQPDQTPPADVGARTAALMDETMHRRLLPGQGAADVAATLRTLRAAGVDAPVGVEVFSDALAAQGVHEAARTAATAARAVLPS